MMLFIDICLYFVFCEIKNLFLFTCIFYTCVYAFYLVFQEIYRLIQLSCCLTCNWWIVVRIGFVFMSIFFVKGFSL